MNAKSAHSLEILLVENHPDTLKYLRMYLEKRGYHTRTACTMHDGLAKLAEEPCEVLISDIGLPDGDGWELMRRAKLPPTVYTIAMSGFGTGSDHLRSKEAGFRHHLLKPFAPEHLNELLIEAERERDTRQAQ